jgi:hypothetical protein
VYKQDKGSSEVPKLLRAVDVCFEFCSTESVFYPANSLSQFAYRITWQKATQRSLLRQYIVSRVLGVLFPCIAVNIVALCAVFKEEGAGSEFRLADKHSFKKNFSLQAKLVLVELKTLLLNFLKIILNARIIVLHFKMHKYWAGLIMVVAHIAHQTPNNVTQWHFVDK